MPFKTWQGADQPPSYDEVRAQTADMVDTLRPVVQRLAEGVYLRAGEIDDTIDRTYERLHRSAERRLINLNKAIAPTVEKLAQTVIGGAVSLDAGVSAAAARNQMFELRLNDGTKPRIARMQLKLRGYTGRHSG